MKANNPGKYKEIIKMMVNNEGKGPAGTSEILTFIEDCKRTISFEKENADLLLNKKQFIAHWRFVEGLSLTCADVPNTGSDKESCQRILDQF